MKTTAMLFRNDEKKWVLSTWKGETIPALRFDNMMQAYAHAKRKGWGVRRAENCDSTERGVA
jgi:hypothetical protein